MQLSSNLPALTRCSPLGKPRRNAESRTSHGSNQGNRKIARHLGAPLVVWLEPMIRERLTPWTPKAVVAARWPTITPPRAPSSATAVAGAELDAPRLSRHWISGDG